MDWSATVLGLIPRNRQTLRSSKIKFWFFCQTFPMDHVVHSCYTCQLFLRYKREIFILGVLGFFEDDKIISEDSRITPRSSEEVRRRPKSAEGKVIESQSWDAYKRELAPSAFHFKNQRSRGRYCHLFILHMVFVPYMGLS